MKLAVEIVSLYCSLFVGFIEPINIAVVAIRFFISAYLGKALVCGGVIIALIFE
jgi:hypothetical protein